MIILVFGKSGTGKTYLSEKLNKDLDNSIHISLDDLNKELMELDKVKDFAQNLFGEEIISEDKINTSLLLNYIKEDEQKYNKWNSYMIDACKNFVENYMAKIHYDYYIIDHINSGIWEFNNSIKIKCVLDDNSRLERLKNRESLDLETLNFRDKYYIDKDCDILYNNYNYSEIMSYIKNK